LGAASAGIVPKTEVLEVLNVLEVLEERPDGLRPLFGIAIFEAE
jgi:hypothetical protein